MGREVDGSEGWLSGLGIRISRPDVKDDLLGSAEKVAHQSYKVLPEGTPENPVEAVREAVWSRCRIPLSAFHN